MWSAGMNSRLLLDGKVPPFSVKQQCRSTLGDGVHYRVPTDEKVAMLHGERLPEAHLVLYINLVLQPRHSPQIFINYRQKGKLWCEFVETQNLKLREQTKDDMCLNPYNTSEASSGGSSYMRLPSSSSPVEGETHWLSGLVDVQDHETDMEQVLESAILLSISLHRMRDGAYNQQFQNCLAWALGLVGSAQLTGGSGETARVSWLDFFFSSTSTRLNRSWGGVSACRHALRAHKFNFNHICLPSVFSPIFPLATIPYNSSFPCVVQNGSIMVLARRIQIFLVEKTRPMTTNEEHQVSNDVITQGQFFQADIQPK